MGYFLTKTIDYWRLNTPLLDFFYNSIDHLQAEGVSFLLHTDLERLHEVNQQNFADGWFPLMPMFDCTKFPSGQAIWIEGVNEFGETVMTEAVRLYELESLAEEMTSLRLFYHDPAADALPRERCICTAPSASQLGGLVACSGAGWARPDYRGRGFATHVPRMVHGLACLLWRPQYIIGLVEPVMVEKGLVPIYGFPRDEPGIRWLGSATEGNLELNLLWMTREECLADLEALPGIKPARRATAA